MFFVGWGEAGVPRENSRIQGEKIQTPHRKAPSRESNVKHDEDHQLLLTIFIPMTAVSVDLVSHKQVLHLSWFLLNGKITLSNMSCAFVHLGLYFPQF